MLYTQKLNSYLYDLINRYPELEDLKTEILEVCSSIVETFKNGGKLLICGNGGSASDSEHIVSELMKSFRIKRPINKKNSELFYQHYGVNGQKLANMLEEGLPTVSLSNSMSLITAISNDVNPSMIYAQQVYGYGSQVDSLLLISTSGNSENVIQAAKVGTVLGLNTISLTGKNGGNLIKYCKHNLIIPQDETYIIQEYHVAVYHTICAVVEESIFGQRD
ncbi:SIS domain-containing protein [Paenibacillus sp. KACC 21273]|uniref:D-sedoheptulose-7-phosphate isomerase n=1 Tax=Paenibacillus sp. KACC 21273 TaxID=3025665 RepID=UPI00236709BF|nr:SIS domain-containing protein [Paenibacillus sp. KACC 21273]WDF52847.1 SIS domain-containing protein [Paenibacillus sp. KACC 21273]